MFWGSHWLQLDLLVPRERFLTWCGKSSHSGRIGEACHGYFLLVPVQASILPVRKQVTLL